MAEVTISDVGGDIWPLPPEYKWQCDQDRPCWSALASTPSEAVLDGRGRGCTHGGRVMLRHAVKAVSHWEPLDG